MASIPPNYSSAGRPSKRGLLRAVASGLLLVGTVSMFGSTVVMSISQAYLNHRKVCFCCLLAGEPSKMPVLPRP